MGTVSTIDGDRSLPAGFDHPHASATLPVPEPDLSRLRAVRHGEVPLADVLAGVDRAEARLERLRDASQLPEQPDRAWVDSWLHQSHLDYWAR